MKKTITFLAICMLLLTTKSMASFTDVDENAWYYGAVKYVAENKILNGVDEEIFAPLDNLTRAMVAQLIYNMEDKPEVESVNTYDDVVAGKWYEKAITWVGEKGIVNGIGDNKFSPDAFITKEQLITILYNYAKYKGYDVSIGEDTNILSYNDCFSLSEYAYAPMQWACGSKIIVGYNGDLLPKKQLTRAEVATIIRNFYMYYNDMSIAWVELEGNPTTGYIWSATDYDESIIKVSDYEYIFDEEYSNLVGQPGKFKFEIKALKEGTTKIVFKYARSWEDNAIKTIVCGVEVDKNNHITLSHQGDEDVKSFIIKSKLVSSNFTEDIRIIKNEEELEKYKEEFNIDDAIFNLIKKSFADYKEEYFKNNRIAVITTQDSGVNYSLVSVNRTSYDTLAVTLKKDSSERIFTELWHIFIELPNNNYSEINNVVISK